MELWNLFLQVFILVFGGFYFYWQEVKIKAIGCPLVYILSGLTEKPSLRWV